MTSVLNVLEVCGILSVNLSASALHALYVHFGQHYRLTLVPGGGYDTPLPPRVAGNLLQLMEKRMALKDAEIALVVQEHVATVDAFLSWNAKHFAGKLAVPAFTPREWLRSRRGQAR